MIELLLFIPVAMTLLSSIFLLLALGFALVWIDHQTHEFIVCRNIELSQPTPRDECFSELQLNLDPSRSLFRFSVDQESLNRLHQLEFQKDPVLAKDGRPYINLKLKALDIKWQPEFQIKAVKASYLD